VLALRLRRREGQPVEQGGPVGKAPLRAGSLDDMAGEVGVEGLGEAVDGMAFGRGELLRDGAAL